MGGGLVEVDQDGQEEDGPPQEPEGESPIASTPTYVYGSLAPTFSRGTKRDSFYEQLSHILILTSGEELEIHTHELILNASIKDVLGGHTEEFTLSYNELKRFMLKILLFRNFVLTCLHWNSCISMWITFFI